MIPISDDNSDRHLTPVVNYIFIALNILVFVFLQGMGTNLHFTYSFAAVPAEILSGSDITTHGQIVVDQYTGEQFEIPGLQVTPIPVYFTLITSMFMHGGWAHLIGNMLYLWVFGDNIENRIGHTKYFIFYQTLSRLLSGSSFLSLSGFCNWFINLSNLSSRRSCSCSFLMASLLVIYELRIMAATNITRTMYIINERICFADAKIVLDLESGFL